MAQNVVVHLTDDLDGGDADETVRFSLNRADYEIDLSTKNAENLRGALAPFIAQSRKTSNHAPTPKNQVSAEPKGKTLFSQLDPEEKDRFRAWAKLPTARRIGDAKVQQWIDAGRH